MGLRLSPPLLLYTVIDTTQHLHLAGDNLGGIAILAQAADTFESIQVVQLSLLFAIVGYRNRESV